MATKKANQGAVTSIADTDLLMVCSPTGKLQPVAFANLMAAVKGQIQIGGRNYIPNSNFEEGLPISNVQRGSFSLVQNSYEDMPIRFGSKALRIMSNNADTYTAPIPVGSLEAERPYTFTIWGRQAGSILGASSYILIDGNPTIALNTIFGGSNTYYKKSVTFTIPKTSQSSGLQYRDVQLRLGFVTSGNAWMLIEAMKLEQGTVATDWTPAPEDLRGGGNWLFTNYLQKHRERRCA